MKHEEFVRSMTELGVDVHVTENPGAADYCARLTAALAETDAPIAVKVFLVPLNGKRHRLGSVRATKQGPLWTSISKRSFGAREAQAARDRGARTSVSPDGALVIGGPDRGLPPGEQVLDQPLRWSEGLDRLLDHAETRQLRLVLPLATGQVWVPWEVSAKSSPSVMALLRAFGAWEATGNDQALGWREVDLGRYVSTRSSPWEAHVIPGREAHRDDDV